jgi:hypothetical protein
VIPLALDRPGADDARRRAVTPRRAGDRAGADGERPLLCSLCGHHITDEAYRIDHAGAHRHTFVNPGGYVHELGCFALAPGVVHVGDPDPTFSWFPGWTWQIGECGACREHIGWLYRCSGEQFHGLVLVRLVAGP